MLHIFNLFLALLILTNAVGLGLLARRYLPLPFGLAQGVGVAGLCAVLFFVEHYFGLGRLGWLMPFSTVASVGLLWKTRSHFSEYKHGVLWLCVGFFYVLAWRYALPNIDGNTERLPDLSFVVAYLQGVTLPPPDPWYPPHLLDHYYTFQHYGAGLLGRWFALDGGTAYQMAYSLLAGLAMSAAYELVALLCKPRWGQAMVLLTFLVGGTGASVFTPFMVKDEMTYDSQRFAGGTTFYDDNRLTNFGLWIKHLHYKPNTNREQVPEVPMETFSYVVELGDYHAPLGGFWIQVLSLGALVLLWRKPSHAWAAGLLGACIPLTIATNTWNLPFQGVMAVGAVAFLWWNRHEHVVRGRKDPPEPVNWQAFLVGLIGTAFLFYPFFSYFLVKNIGNKSPLEIVPLRLGTQFLTPPLLFAMIFWPLFVVGIAHMFGSQGARRLHAFFWFAALLVTELIFVNDIYAGSAERFNTTLKWWPWVFNGTMLTLAASNLNAGRSFRRYATVVVLALLLTYTVSLGRYYFGTIRNLAKLGTWHVGQLNGSAWIRHDPPLRTALEFLTKAPKGIVLESPDNMAFCQVGAYGLFSQQPTLLGWASHEQLWRNYLTDTYDRYLKIKEFYEGKMADPAAWLKGFEVRYILWLPRDNNNKEALARLSAQLAADYQWHEFYRANDYAVGIWSRRTK
ncbi:MAG: hypothetical protein JSR82_17660 [Verrucomicrobia bacterium]|nr:hypothetical protein [Verrucomicrobiota bacterium]